MCMRQWLEFCRFLLTPFYLRCTSTLTFIFSYLSGWLIFSWLCCIKVLQWKCPRGPISLFGSTCQWNSVYQPLRHTCVCNHSIILAGRAFTIIALGDGGRRIVSSRSGLATWNTLSQNKQQKYRFSLILCPLYFDFIPVWLGALLLLPILPFSYTFCIHLLAKCVSCGQRLLHLIWSSSPFLSFFFN